MSGDIKTEIASKLLDSVPVLLLILGAAILVLGLAGDVKYQTFDLPLKTPYNIVAIGVGIVMIGTALFLNRQKETLPKAEKYGIKITYPKSGDKTDQINVSGSIEKSLPVGYALRVFRVFSNNDYVPVSTALIGSDKRTWEAVGCTTGGSSGEQRWFAVCLVGPNGSELLKYFEMASKFDFDQRTSLKKSTGTELTPLPPIKGRTSDIVECDRVKVYRA